jgi:hypothetical protein
VSNCVVPECYNLLCQLNSRLTNLDELVVAAVGNNSRLSRLHVCVMRRIFQCRVEFVKRLSLWLEDCAKYSVVCRQPMSSLFINYIAVV